jgi:hypothetical protein
MAAQLDAIMKKLEYLEASTEAIAPRAVKDEPRLRQWLKSLRNNPLKEPSHTRAFDELAESPMASLSTRKPETNH